MGGTISAIVLPETPAVLSLGRKCLDEGYAFIWKGKEKPYLLTPGDKRVYLDVVNYVPMLAVPSIGSSSSSQGATPAEEVSQGATLAKTPNASTVEPTKKVNETLP